MYPDKKYDPADTSGKPVDPKDTSQPGREEEVVDQHNETKKDEASTPPSIERAFKEGQQNNNDNDPAERPIK